MILLSISSVMMLPVMAIYYQGGALAYFDINLNYIGLERLILGNIGQTHVNCNNHYVGVGDEMHVNCSKGLISELQFYGLKPHIEGNEGEHEEFEHFSSGFCGDP